MRYILIAALISWMTILAVNSDELTELQQVQKKETAAKKTLAEKQNENDELKRRISTLSQTAEITLNPTSRAKVFPHQKVKLFFFALDSTSGFKGNNQTGFSIVDLPDGKAIKIQSPPGTESISRLLSVPENSIIRISVKMKGENVTKIKPEYFRGTRLGAVVPNGDKPLYPSAPASVGSFDWRECSFETKIPSGCKHIWVTLGMSGATGTVYMRDLLVEKVGE